MAVTITYFVHGTTTDNEQHRTTGWNPGDLNGAPAVTRGPPEPENLAGGDRDRLAADQVVATRLGVHCARQLEAGMTIRKLFIKIVWTKGR